MRRNTRRSSNAVPAPAPLEPPEAPESELLDISIDMNWAKVNCKEPEAFAREPWKHTRDAPNTYLSIRVKKRQEFLEQLDSTKRRRVQHEIDRIKQTRVNFAAYPGRDIMVKELHKARISWRQEVIDRREDYIKTVQKTKVEKEQELKESEQRCKGTPNHMEDSQKSKDEIAKLNRDLALLRRLRGWKADDIHDTDQAAVEVQVEKLYGFKASVMYFEKSNSGWTKHTSEDDRFGGAKFPNQKLLVSKLLEDEEDNLLSESSKSDCLRYFHFPTNNMSWIEKAIARYYNEKYQEFDEFKGYDTMTRAEKLLSREYWRGQMHGSRGEGRHGMGTGIKGPVHARHMRPRCSIIPRPQKKTAEKPSSDDPPKPRKDVALFLPYLHWEMSGRRAKMNQVIQEATGGEAKRHKLSKPGLISIVKQAQKKYKRSDESGWKLGNYLMKLAQVADAIDYEADERLLRENINHNPPLHTRRTLDQYYFSTLEDTSTRDEDQVVFRGTRRGKSFHSKNTRILMVDQLWLWILDDNTIITSFPRRWGRNKPDPSGVHKSLRERLQNMNEDIKSIHHLALIIIDQCSRVFFDRTKPLDERPEVMDLFAAAIGHVTELTAIAYEGFWRNTKLQAMNLLPGENDSAKHRFLDINPEGTLLRESQDIAEELKIMLRIYNEQIAVLKEFRRYLAELSVDRSQGGSDIAVMHRLLDLLEERSTGISSHPKRRDTMKDPSLLKGTAHEADLLLEQLKNRQAEILDLEESALRTCQQQERLLALKQQQASIVEAKAALRRADESVKQGRAIMAFTIVTIFFLPLGFFAAFFGMNNTEINGATWMTLGSQLEYMFGLSAIVIILAVSVAFSNWARAVLKLLVRVPLVLVGEHSGIQEVWSRWTVDSRSLERRTKRALDDVSRRRQDRRKKEAQALRDTLLEKGKGEGNVRSISSSGRPRNLAAHGQETIDVSMVEMTEQGEKALARDSKALDFLWNIMPRKRKTNNERFVV